MSRNDVIGLDFGNCNSFPCIILDFDPSQQNRLGGKCESLLPEGLQDGIPSVFFYEKSKGVLCGEEAVRGYAKPVSNRVRYLKGYLAQPDRKIELDDRVFSPGEAITAVIQHCVRTANKRMQAEYQMTTNQICLAYPVTFSCAQREELVSLAEQATLADGKTKVKVVGTIMEPAAAALDYLSEYGQDQEETTVLTLDLGGGTFDLALVAAYPKGKSNSSGDVRYYYVIDRGGLPDMGGGRFDQVMTDILMSKVDVELSNAEKEVIRNMAESTKKNLSTAEVDEPMMLHEGEFLNMVVTREEFEKAAAPLLEQILDAAVKMFRKQSKEHKIDLILLTGGASNMPMLRKGLEKTLPEMKGKIDLYRPSKAVAFGAARYGTVEQNTDPTVGNPVQQSTGYDLGIMLQRVGEKDKDKRFFIRTCIKAGTEIPVEGSLNKCYTVGDGDSTSLDIYEAKVKEPDSDQPARDYRRIKQVIFKFHKEVPDGTEINYRLYIDKMNMLHLNAKDSENPEITEINEKVLLENLVGMK